MMMAIAGFVIKAAAPTLAAATPFIDTVRFQLNGQWIFELSLLNQEDHKNGNNARHRSGDRFSLLGKMRMAIANKKRSEIALY